MPREGEHLVAIPLDDPAPGSREIEASLEVPDEPIGAAMLVHGGLSSRCCPRDLEVAAGLRRRGFATLCVDLLSWHEAEEEISTGRHGLDLALLAERVLAATRWVAASPATCALPLGHLGAGTGAAAVLAAAAAVPDLFAAVVSCGGRADLVPPALLARVESPVLLVEGTAETGPRAKEKDDRLLALARAARERLPCARLAVVRGATHWLAEPGAAGLLARLAAGWFEAHLVGPDRWALAPSRLPADDAPTGPAASRVRSAGLGL
jgi:dienelactone hydrolase